MNNLDEISNTCNLVTLDEHVASANKIIGLEEDDVKRRISVTAGESDL